VSGSPLLIEVSIVGLTKNAVTVSAAVSEIAPLLAVMVAIPSATPVASPEELTVAAELLEDVHAMVMPDIGLPNWSLGVAVNCWVEPIPTEAVEGVRSIEEKTGLSLDPPVHVPESILQVIVAVGTLGFALQPHARG
jgi:hypothetical protein